MTLLVFLYPIIARANHLKQSQKNSIHNWRHAEFFVHRRQL